MKFKGFGDWIEIFRGGKQIDSDGVQHDGDAMIDRAVAKFDTSVHEPPVVIGHPADNAPAYGWVEGLAKSFKDGTKVLLAKVKQVVPEFSQMVEQGLFKKRSAAFYPDGTLRHVGFLGAVPPAVKGLKDIGFKEKGISFEFADGDDKEAQQARAKKYGIAVKEGGHVTKPGEWESVPDDQFLDPVNYRYPCPNADQTRAAASYWGQEGNQAQYSSEERSVINERLDKFRKKFGIGEFKKETSNQGGGGMDKFMEFIEFLKFWKKIQKDPDLDLGDNKGKTFSEADIEAAKKKAAEDERKRVEAEFAEKGKQGMKKQRADEVKAFCEQLVKEGKIPPAWVDAGLVQFMQGLDAENVIAFSEQKKQSGLDWMKDFLGGFGKADLFKEIATKDSKGVQFSEAKAQEELGKKIAAKVNPKKQS